jgi:hypothetical protein
VLPIGDGTVTQRTTQCVERWALVCNAVGVLRYEDVAPGMGTAVSTSMCYHDTSLCFDLLFSKSETESIMIGCDEVPAPCTEDVEWLVH